ncbi:hypothetical protein ONZ43_g2153 [Nemania bipapillata]|uniref:Uncharacterized protein n=1 Tax=Nemania bipapillata TaxID=110536 RepID=A0ACC2J1Q2_9PEZI|nr:hypothetical protein ONZ43_g2153 [Nemania bipapillata]
MTSIQNAVEDEFGDVDRLAIYNLLPSTSPSAVLPLGAIVAIKEPYYKRTADGGLFVRVDHPTDFVPLKPGNSIIPSSLAARITKKSTSALRLKECGNSAFKSGDFETAADFYSDALEVAGQGEDELKQDLHRNRAAANLRIGRYDLAITDALASLLPPGNTSETTRSVNIKALYRAGKAAYEMQDFNQAKRYFDQALELDGGHKEARAEIARTVKRISEQENGHYNFVVMAKSATMQHSQLDHSSFLRRTKVSQTDNRGRGLFSTERLVPGDIVFVEKAFNVAHRDGENISVLLNLNTDRISLGTHNLRLYGTIDKIIWNPTFAKNYLDLFDGGKFKREEEPKVIDGRVIVDTFQVQSIAELNGFGCPRVKSRDESDTNEKSLDHETSTGIWLQASYANHSCLPNVTRAFIGDMMIVHAVRDIPAGGEIFMGYLSPDIPFAERTKRLNDHYGFRCHCDLCQAEAEVPKVAVEKRARLSKEIKLFLSTNRLNSNDIGMIPGAKKARARQLLVEIRETYPKALFEQLPRLQCVEIGLWVAQSAMVKPQYALGKFIDVLRDLGYFVTIKGRNVTVDRRGAVQRVHAVHAAMYAAQCLAAIGNEGAALALESFGKGVFIAISGSEDGFAVEFGRS